MIPRKIILGFLSLGLANCAAAPEPKMVSANTVDAPLSDRRDLAKVFHTKRFSLRVPFADGAAWSIDDHSQPFLRASHAPTHSELTLEVFPTDELVGRHGCEDHATRRGLLLVPLADMKPPPVVVDDATVFGPDEFDTRAISLVEIGKKDSPLRGHLYAFGGHLKKCFFFHFSTEAKSESVIGTRLATARAIMFDGIKQLDFEQIPRESLTNPSR